MSRWRTSRHAPARPRRDPFHWALGQRSVGTGQGFPPLHVRAVRRPGVYRVAAAARVFEVVAEAGGFADDADQEAIALAAQLSDGCTIDVPRVGESTAGEIRGPAQSCRKNCGSLLRFFHASAHKPPT